MKFAIALIWVSFAAGAGAGGSEARIAGNFPDPEVARFIRCVARNNEDVIHRCPLERSKINAPGRNGVTPLAWLLYNERIPPRTMMELIRAGADPHAGAASAAGYAIQSLPIEYLLALVDGGLDINNVENPNEDRGWHDSFLFSAIMSRDPEKVRLLIGRGANVNITNSTGDTPLLFAVNQYAVQILLLQAGADPRAVDRSTGADICDVLATPHTESADEVDLAYREAARADLTNRAIFIAMLRERGVDCRSQ